jgi:hypothetical protein
MRIWDKIRNLFLLAMIATVLSFQTKEEQQGPSSPGIILGVHIPPVTNYGDEIKAFNNLTGRQHPIVMYYNTWSHRDALGRAFDEYLPNQLKEIGATPMITWEPFGIALSDIANGVHDDYIREFARGIKGYKNLILIRFAHEMNCDYYPWFGDPKSYILAWRHIHGIFEEEEVTNVQWVWAPNFMSNVPDHPYSDYNLYYPGNDYVDWIGVSGYNWGDVPNIDFTFLFDEFLKDTACRYPKPQMIAEIGTVDAGGIAKTDWIADAYKKMPLYPFLQAVSWFNDYAYSIPGQADFRVTKVSKHNGDVADYPPYTTAYKNAIANSSYISSIPSLDLLTPPGTFCPGQDIISVSPSFKLALVDSTSTFKVTAIGITSTVSLSLAGLPDESTYGFSPSSLDKPWGSSILTITVHYTGEYPLNVTAIGEVTHTTEILLYVTSQIYEVYLPIVLNRHLF